MLSRALSLWLSPLFIGVGACTVGRVVAWHLVNVHHFLGGWWMAAAAAAAAAGACTMHACRLAPLLAQSQTWQPAKLLP